MVFSLDLILVVYRMRRVWEFLQKHTTYIIALKLYPREIVRRLQGAVRHLLRHDQENDPEILQLLALMRKGHQEGFEYHQRMYREDPEVRSWVHKQNYF